MGFVTRPVKKISRAVHPGRAVRRAVTLFLGGIVTIGIITAPVSSGRQTASVINGNRWWVAGDVTTGPDGPDGPYPGNYGAIARDLTTGYQVIASGGAKADAELSATPAGDVVLNLDDGSGTRGSQFNWIVMGGPYPSRASATAAIPAIQAAHSSPGTVAQIPGGSAIADIPSAIGKLSAGPGAPGEGAGLLLGEPPVPSCRGAMETGMRR